MDCAFSQLPIKLALKLLNGSTIIIFGCVLADRSLLFVGEVRISLSLSLPNSIRLLMLELLSYSFIHLFCSDFIDFQRGIDEREIADHV